MNAAIDELRTKNNYGQIKKYLLQNPIVHQENVAVNIATDRSSNTLSALYQNDRQHYKKQNSTKYMVNSATGPMYSSGSTSTSTAPTPILT